MMNKKIFISFIFFLIACCPADMAQEIVLKERHPEKAVVNEESIYIVVEQQPEYPGGSHEMMMFIQKEIKFPANRLADTSFAGCKSYIRMVIDTNGRITDPTILKGCTGCPECDAEGIRVVKAMPLWKPARQNGRKVKVYYNIPISYRKQ